MNSLQDVIYRLEKVIQTGATDKDGMHPISAERVLEELKSISIDAKAEEILNHLYDAVNGINALVDRPSGEWIHNPNGIDRDFIWWKCSECGHVIYSESEHDREEFHAFCGRCGARMKGADDER